MRPDELHRKEARAVCNKARKNAKTCPASRHVHMIVDGMTGKKSPLREALSDFEPDHMAGSIASVLSNLWHARQWLKWEPLPPTKRYPSANGHWVPDLEAIAKWQAKP